MPRKPKAAKAKPAPAVPPATRPTPGPFIVERSREPGGVSSTKSGNVAQTR